jgi:hypothetical protein
LAARPDKVEELGHVEDGEDLAYDRRGGPAVGVVNDPRRSKPDSLTANLKRAAAGSQDVLDPIGVGAVGERDHKPVPRAEYVDRSAVYAARSTTFVLDDPEARQPAGDECRDPVGDDPVEARDRTWNHHRRVLPVQGEPGGSAQRSAPLQQRLPQEQPVVDGDQLIENPADGPTRVLRHVPVVDAERSMLMGSSVTLRATG